MTQAPLEGVRACVFDAYGTLFDFAAAAKGCRDLLGDDIDRLTGLWREKQLQYTWLRAVQDRHEDFWQVTGDALDFALETLGIEKPGLRERLMTLYLTLDAFPEVPTVLMRLKQAGLQTAILSNGSPKMIDAVVKSANLVGLIDAVLSVEEVGIYKPHPKVYQLAVDRLKVPASAIAFQSSNATRYAPMAPFPRRWDKSSQARLEKQRHDSRDGWTRISGYQADPDKESHRCCRDQRPRLVPCKLNLGRRRSGQRSPRR